MKYIIDRFEGGAAVCEDENKQFISIDRKLLPRGFKEGSSFQMDENGGFILLDDTERKERIKSKMDALWK